MMSTARRNWIAAFYWIGVAMTVACFAFILAGNTELAGRFEHRGFPLSWVFGGVAVVAFLAAEACHTALSSPEEARLPAELMAVESQS
jgi:hypothetical protein